MKYKLQALRLAYKRAAAATTSYISQDRVYTKSRCGAYIFWQHRKRSSDLFHLKIENNSCVKNIHRSSLFKAIIILSSSFGRDFDKPYNRPFPYKRNTRAHSRRLHCIYFNEFSPLFRFIVSVSGICVWWFTLCDGLSFEEELRKAQTL